MNLQSLLPFLLLLLPFVIAFLLEALVLYGMKLKRFWPAVGIATLVNLITLAITFYLVTALLSKLHYEFNGLELPLQAVFFLWWFSTVLEIGLLRLFIPAASLQRLSMASIWMNALSYGFLYFFIINSHS